MPGAAAANTAGPSAGQRAHLGPGQAKGGTKGGLFPATLISSQLRVARRAQLRHCSPDPAEHCIIPSAASGSAARATPRRVSQPSCALGQELAAPGSAAHGGRFGTLGTARGLLRALLCSGPACGCSCAFSVQGSASETLWGLAEWGSLPLH